MNNDAFFLAEAPATHPTAIGILTSVDPTMREAVEAAAEDPVVLTEEIRGTYHVPPLVKEQVQTLAHVLHKIRALEGLSWVCYASG